MVRVFVIPCRLSYPSMTKTPKNPMSGSTFLRRPVGLATVGLAAIALSGTAIAQSVWTGAVSNDYNNADNWSPSGIPGQGTNIVIDSSTTNPTVITGNWSRRQGGSTTISGTANVTVSGGQGRLLNGGPGDFNMLGGTLNHTGEYFLVGASDPNTVPGKLNQSGGTITSAVSRGFFLSDNSINQTPTSYNMTGGTLTVTSQATYNIGTEADRKFRSVWFGKAGEVGGLASNVPGDFFHITNGIASFTKSTGAGTGTGDLLLSRNASLLVDGGTVSFHNYTEVRVGFQKAGTVNSNITVNGGSLSITGPTNVVLGYDDDGHLNINSGTVTLDGILQLGRVGGGNGFVAMTAGTLFAQDIVQNTALSTFTFSGGSITLIGNQTDIVDQTWFLGVAGTFASYDALNNVTTITVVPEPQVYGLALAGGLGLLVFARLRKRARHI